MKVIKELGEWFTMLARETRNSRGGVSDCYRTKSYLLITKRGGTRANVFALTPH